MSLTFAQLLETRGNEDRVTGERVVYAMAYIAAQEDLSLAIVMVCFRRSVHVAVCDGWVAGRLAKESEGDASAR